MINEPSGSVHSDQPGRLANVSVPPHGLTKPRSKIALLVITCGAVFFLCAFIALGTWQLARLKWKLDLIQRVESRVHAPATSIPPASKWDTVTAASDEYRHVRASGQLLHDRAVWVQASTVLGSGYWLLTPLRLQDGNIILINRGFVPTRGFQDASAAAPQGSTEVTVTGLLRITEPKGAFLRKNDPANDRWYSRDTAAIADRKGLKHVAPFFIDADAYPSTQHSSSNEASYPVGGLTIITFHNSHLVYAITWYALALLVVGGYWLVIREEKKRKPLP